MRILFTLLLFTVSYPVDCQEVGVVDGYSPLVCDILKFADMISGVVPGGEYPGLILSLLESLGCTGENFAQLMKLELEARDIRDINNTMDGLTQAYKTMINWKNVSMDVYRSFALVVETDAPLFLKKDAMAPKAQSSNFAQYCALQITIFSHINSPKDLTTIAHHCCNTARRLIVEVAGEGAYYYQPARREMIRGLEIFLNHWKKFYPGCMTTEDYYVKDWDLVAFKEVGDGLDDYWMSCVTEGSWCIGRSCPGHSGPFYPNPKDYRRCFGEVFWIKKVLQNGGYIRSCDIVGIQYSKTGYWLSDDNHWLKTRPCPGSNIQSRSYCECEQFVIKHSEDKKCGEIINHLDSIQLTRPKGNFVLITSHYFNGYPIRKDWYDGSTFRVYLYPRVEKNLELSGRTNLGGDQQKTRFYLQLLKYISEKTPIIEIV